MVSSVNFAHRLNNCYKESTQNGWETSTIFVEVTHFLYKININFSREEIINISWLCGKEGNHVLLFVLTAWKISVGGIKESRARLNTLSNKNNINCHSPKFTSKFITFLIDISAQIKLWSWSIHRSYRSDIKLILNLWQKRVSLKFNEL